MRSKARKFLLDFGAGLLFLDLVDHRRAKRTARAAARDPHGYLSAKVEEMVLESELTRRRQARPRRRPIPKPRRWQVRGRRR